MDITEISDRLELEKLVTDYATAIDSRDFKQLNNLFTPDAHIDYTAVGGIAGSLAEIIAFLETALDFFPNYQHFISNISLTINGNTATGKVMCFNPMQTKREAVDVAKLLTPPSDDSDEDDDNDKNMHGRKHVEI